MGGKSPDPEIRAKKTRALQLLPTYILQAECVTDGCGQNQHGMISCQAFACPRRAEDGLSEQPFVPGACRQSRLMLIDPSITCSPGLIRQHP